MNRFDVRRLLERIFNGFGDILFRLTVHRTARAVSIRDVEVIARSGAPGPVPIVARYSFTVLSEEQEPLAFDLRPSQFPVNRVLVSTEDGLKKEFVFARRRKVLVVEPVADSWAATTVEIQFEWSDGVAGGMTFPSMLPRVGSAEHRPSIRLRCEPPGSLRLAGVSVDGSPVAWGSELIEGVLLRGDAVGRELAVFSEHFAREVRPKTVDRAHHLIQRATDFIGGELRVSTAAVLAVRHPAEYMSYRLSRGATIQLDPEVLGTDGSDPNYFSIGTEVAAVWWGSGCSISGAHGYAFEYALRGFLGLRWCYSIDPVLASNVAKRLVALSVPAGARLRNRTASVGAGMRLDRTLDLVLSLYQRFQETNAVMTTLRALTRDTWGSQVKQEEVIRRLRDAGVSVPF